MSKVYNLLDDAWMKSAYVLSVTMHFPNYRDQSRARDNRSLNLQEEDDRELCLSLISERVKDVSVWDKFVIFWFIMVES